VPELWKIKGIKNENNIIYINNKFFFI
jgi:hypothetical protein